MKLILAYLPLALWAAAVLAVGTLQLSAVSVPSGWDKGAHFVMYGVGGAIAAWTGSRRGRRQGITALLFVLVVGMADELHQSRLATRQSDILDWVADAAGAGLFYLAAGRLLPNKESDRT
ncbi:MAG: VanZ family protein [Longimicrobiales bacterium]|nr:VanZ family protein [Longimicrobiales bacterium]